MVKSPEGFECPRDRDSPEVGVGVGALTKLIEDATKATNPTTGSDTSGTFILSAKTTGSSCIGAMSSARMGEEAVSAEKAVLLNRFRNLDATKMRGDHTKDFDPSTFSSLKLNFLGQSAIFDVQPPGKINSTTSSGSPTSSGSLTDDGGSQYTNKSKEQNSHGGKTPVGAIVGGVMGGVALILLVLVGFMIIRRKTNNPRGRNHISLSSTTIYRPSGGSHAHIITPFNLYAMADETTMTGQQGRLGLAARKLLWSRRLQLQQRTPLAEKPPRATSPERQTLNEFAGDGVPALHHLRPATAEITSSTRGNEGITQTNPDDQGARRNTVPPTRYVITRPRARSLAGTTLVDASPN
ncbi:hypothetical protein L218DRAFT_1009605 [Marasmius fiardii PR-910]|nr:hypothetical protein L218DRAFT_1009605 [Marasmius fiardii PR-910]